MKLATIPTPSAIGQILAAPIRRADGRPILQPGRTLTAGDIEAATRAHYIDLIVAELAPGEMSESDAVELIAPIAAHGPVDYQPGPAGRLNLLTKTAGCILVNQAALTQINASRAVSIATVAHLSYLPAGAMLATVQTAPFAVSRAAVERLSIAIKAQPPALQFLAINGPRVAVIYADRTGGESAARQYEPIMRKRLARHGVDRVESLRASESAIGPALRAMLQARASVVVIASATAPQWEGGPIARQVEQVTGRPPQFHLMPVTPGKVIMIDYTACAAIVCAPGAYRQGNVTSFDLILPALLAGHSISAADIARLGEGGLLSR